MRRHSGDRRSQVRFLKRCPIIKRLMPEQRSRRAMKCAFLALCFQVTTGLAVTVALAPEPMFGAVAAPTAQEQGDVNANEAPVEFWNREIAVMHLKLLEATPQERAARAAQRLQELPLNARAQDIVVLQLSVAGQEGLAFGYKGRGLFFLGRGDLDVEPGQTLDQSSERVLKRLDEALVARQEERQWPVIRSGLLFTLLGLMLMLLAAFSIWRAYRWAALRMRATERSLRGRLRLANVDILPHIARIANRVLLGAAWVLSLIAFYLWLTFSLRQFPYTEPWGNQLGVYVLQLIQQLVQAAVRALPGCLAALIIFIIARWIAAIGKAFFDQVTTGGIRIPWMDPDVAHATQRIFTAFVWIFATVVAYPYIPGSNTEAFKGISVFFGLVISLGSTGIINQVMSGLFVVYSKALKSGEWVRVNETEGEVLEVGLLAAKVRTIEGQEVTIPNAVLVGTSTINYSRLGYPDGMIASVTATIGYDAPWRQVHALLILAAGRTTNIRKQPEAYVLQRQLADFYVEYTLVVRLHDEKDRINTISRLISNIQDAFNEYGVQIMSPHFMIQPERNVGVPPSKWHQAPSSPAADPAQGSADSGDGI
jgi:small-conductance mechanosensitive channel